MGIRVATVISTILLTAATPSFGGWDEGVAAYRAKNYAQAAREFESVVQEKADWAGGYFMLGRTQLQLGRTNDAVGNLRKAYDLDPSNVETQLFLAQAYLGANRNSEASQLLSKLNSASVPREQQSLYQSLLGKAAAESGQTGRALDALERAAAASPNDASAQYNFGVVALNAGQTADAVTALERAARLDPADANKQKVLVQAMLKRGRELRDAAQKNAMYARASEIARAMVGKSASYDSLLLLGESQLGAKQYTAAAITFNQAASKNGSDWLPHFYAGQAFTASGSYGDAESSLRRSLERASSSGDKERIWRQMGFVYEKQKNFPQAKSAYRNGNDPASLRRVEENEEIARHNQQAEAEAEQLRLLEEQKKALQEAIQNKPPV